MVMPTGVLPLAKRARTQQESASPSETAPGAQPPTAGQLAQARPLTPTSSTGGIRACAQTLPAEMLRQIFSYLPISAQDQCALVCRGWYATVPDTWRQVTRWLRHQPPQLRQTSRFMAMAYSCRLHPWLASLNCRQLPLLECQYQELLRHEQTGHERSQPPPPEQQARVRREQRFFSGLLLYVLHHQIIQAEQLSLRAAVLQDRTGTIVAGAFSPCSRWLTTIQRLEEQGAIHSCLHVHGWTQGAWQPEMKSLPDPAPEIATFSESQPGTLVSAHAGGLVHTWHRNKETGIWQLRHRIQAPSGQQVKCLIANPDGDLISLSRREGASLSQLLLIPHEQQLGLGSSQSTLYQPSLAALALAPASRQLAVAIRPLLSSQECAAIHIWERHLHSPFPAVWGFRETRLEYGLEVLLLTYSPDASLILGFMHDSRILLWALDRERALQPRLEVTAIFSKAPEDVKSHVLFSSNSQRLALPHSMQETRLWDRRPDGSWTAGETIDTSSDADTSGEDSLRYILLAGDGQTLVHVTHTRLGIWRRIAAGNWQQLLTRQAGDPASPLPRAWLLPPGQLLCATVTGREGDLWIHGPDNTGQFVRKAAFTLGMPVQLLYPSQDGLSLLLSCIPGQETLVQLAPPQEPAAPEPSPGDHDDS